MIMAHTVIGGCPEGAEGLLFAQQRLVQPCGIHIARDKARVAAVVESLRFFAPQVLVITLPDDDCLPYDRTGPSVGVALQRMIALQQLAQREPQQPCQVVLSAEAALRQLPPWEELQHAICGVRVGTIVTDIPAKLQAAGYIRVATVREAGEFSLRGGVIDIYPAHLPRPIRLDCMGKQVERLYTFDPDTQRSDAAVLQHVHILPVSEVVLTKTTCQHFVQRYTTLYPQGASDALCEAVALGQRRQGAEHALALFYSRLNSVFDLLPHAAITCDDGAAPLAQQHYAAIDKAHQYRTQVYAQKQVGDRPLPPHFLYTMPRDFGTIVTPNATPQNDYGGRVLRNFEAARRQGQLMTQVAQTIQSQQALGQNVLIACISDGSCDRMQRLLATQKVRNVQTVVLALEQGFTWPQYTVLTEADIFGERRSAPRRKSSARAGVLESLLEVGDYAVHKEHGIARYNGLHTITAMGAPHECLLLEYAGGDKLYVPAENADLVSRYASAHDTVGVDSLGGLGWQKRKAKVKERIREMAAELIRLAAERQLRTAQVLSTTGTDYDTFCAGFAYEETPDQLQAIADVLADLTSGQPADRLVCGDVGFGKTEVALRAAYVAAACGKQVALVVPTTLLARQHYNTFLRRFEGTGLRVGQLSRLVTAKDAKLVKEGLATGHIDIVVGTHALLAKDIQFKTLGVLIVDEEQHFGVAHKEALKGLRTDLHVFTLTATPIPRTLQAAVGGLRRLSLLTTPPPERLSVNTYVTPFDAHTIADALLREKERGGQSFFVVPRIADMHDAEEFLRQQVPHLSVAAVHGRMTSTAADTAMNAFYDGKHDVLLSTAIVESGIDVPSAGTMIVWRADMFGLAQLHQLRGRIGRARQRGYAYLTTPMGHLLSDHGRRRLEVLANTNSLGGGFHIANHDLDARGAGNLLGEEQSGYVREVGFELYKSMLDEAVAALKAGEQDTDLPPNMPYAPRLTIDTAVRIPDSYISDSQERLRFYRRLATATQVADINAIADELLDRYGAMPSDVQAFLTLAQVRVLCKTLGIDRAEAGPKGILLGFYKDTPQNPAAVIAWVGQNSANVRVRPDKRVFISSNSTMNGTQSLQRLLQVVEQLHG